MRWDNKDIPDQAILTYIENNARFRKKVGRLLGTITGGQTKLDADGRSERARLAGKASGVSRRSSKKTAG